MDTTNKLFVHSATEDPTLARLLATDEEAFHENFQRHYAGLDAAYEDFAPAYHFGFQQAKAARYQNQTFFHVEPLLKAEFTDIRPGADWEQLHDAILYGWERAGGEVGGWPLI